VQVSAPVHQAHQLESIQDEPEHATTHSSEYTLHQKHQNSEYTPDILQQRALAASKAPLSMNLSDCGSVGGGGLPLSNRSNLQQQASMQCIQQMQSAEMMQHQQIQQHHAAAAAQQHAQRHHNLKNAHQHPQLAHAHQHPHVITFVIVDNMFIYISIYIAYTSTLV